MFSNSVGLRVACLGFASSTQRDFSKGTGLVQNIYRMSQKDLQYWIHC